jgi:hypothetical protein
VSQFLTVSPEELPHGASEPTKMRFVSRSQFEMGSEFQVLHLGVNSLGTYESAVGRVHKSGAILRIFLRRVSKASVQFKVLQAGLKVLQTAFKVLQTVLKVLQMAFKVLQIRP